MTASLDHQSLGTFLDTLASRAPTPGGGSVAALNGAMAAGLISMVCALTIGKAQYAAIEEDLRGIHDRAETLRRELQHLADQDIEAFERLSVAYRLPRTTEADAAVRRAAIQQVTRQAAEIPLRTAQAAAALIPLCTSLAPQVGRLIVSDIGVAILITKATIQSAILNVEINLAGLDDQQYVRETRASIEDLVANLNEKTEEIVAIVRDRING
ncbi:cyclodeaminase/cyclohydrolase family protein [Candidatus Chloroploca sp. M-50]|uniref:Cyclodeaminase/cyclohydrolase family protein n=1 Tax=Candidatus Chloroploca mongolica TaxID=2528176 RepID=A0ABS4D921_9CHLR|nr:cyclodeaminase/cyclohydrolase family protein [Candidatus Chloroploca mongolica]MBP1465949.1 cyclodeaminase/cyclohydrolase family protein [Candidatus Chloroploca mongolica]